MFEFLTASENDAIVILKSDHETVKDLFERFEKSNDRRVRQRIASEAIMELKIHTEIEEKIFYPSVRIKLDKQLMNEADEEHHVAKFLIAELEHIDSKDDHWEAKFRVLAESVRHHIREEETTMFPAARKLAIDFEALGQALLALKQQLKENGVPVCEEEKWISRYKGNMDSPKKAAKVRLSAGALKKSTIQKNIQSHSSSRGSKTVKKPTARRHPETKNHAP
jgi:hemerythrin superfamily protein